MENERANENKIKYSRNKIRTSNKTQGKDENTKIKIDESGIRIRKNDGKSVVINLDGIHIENEKGEKIEISIKAIGGAVIVGLVFIIIIISIALFIFRKFIIYLFKTLFYSLKKIFRKIIDYLKTTSDS